MSDHAKPCPFPLPMRLSPPRFSLFLLLLLLACFWCVLPVFCQTAGDFVQATALGGQQNDRISALATGTGGQTYVAGRISGTVRYGNRPFTGDDDLFILATDAAGTFRWAIRPSGIGRSEVYALAFDPKGFLYVAGVFRDTIRIGSQTWISNRRSNDAFLWKVNTTTGQIVWGQTYGSQYDDAALAIDFHPKGGLVVGGLMGAPLALNSETTLSASDDREGWLAVLEPETGNLRWAFRIGGGEKDKGRGERVSALRFAAGGTQVVAGGHFDGPWSEAAGVPISARNYEGFVAVFDAFTGAVSWVKAAGGTSEVRVVVADDALGRVYAAGSFSDWLVWQLPVLPSRGGTDAAWVAFDLKTGQTLFTGSTGTPGNDAIHAAALDSAGRLWLGGEQAAGTFGGSDAALWQLTRTDGQVLFSQLAGGPDDDAMSSLVAAGDALLAGGSFEINSRGQAQFGQRTLTGTSEALEPTTDAWWARWEGMPPACTTFRVSHVFRIKNSHANNLTRSLVAHANGGTEPYLWRAGAGSWQPTGQWTNLPQGPVRIEVYDAAGCRVEWFGVLE